MRLLRPFVLVVLLLVISSLFQSCGGSSNSTPPTQTSPPPTLQFSVSSASITVGDSTTLTWTATNADSVTIDNGIGVEPISGSVAVSPTQNVTYTAGATRGS